MFGILPSHVFNRLSECPIDVVPPVVDSPRIVEGVEVIDTLLPVSKLTGRREDPLTLLKSQFSKDSRLLDSLLQELPTIPSDPNLSDADKVQLLAGKFDQGTPADNDAFVSRLMEVSDVLFPAQSKQAVQEVKQAAAEEHIDFKPEDIV